MRSIIRNCIVVPHIGIIRVRIIRVCSIGAVAILRHPRLFIACLAEGENFLGLVDGISIPRSGRKAGSLSTEARFDCVTPTSQGLAQPLFLVRRPREFQLSPPKRNLD